MSPLFKIGDRVKFIGGSTSYFFGGIFEGKANRGDIFTISAAREYPHGNSYGVKGSYMTNNANWCNMEKNFELVSPKTWKERMLQ